MSRQRLSSCIPTSPTTFCLALTIAREPYYLNALLSVAAAYHLLADMSNIVGDVEGVPQTFSSWDSCMSKSYCKYVELRVLLFNVLTVSARYPAIAGIVIVSLVVLSIVWCFARCLCCGASCCCECFRCCGCLESCTRPRGSNGSRYKDQYAPVQNQQPMPYQGYQASPMMYQPQFATFDASSNKIPEDSLPAMPSWDTAQTRKVEDHSHDMEMKDLEHQASGGQRLSRNANSYAPVSNGPASPVHSPYDHQPQTVYMHGATQPYGSDLGAQRLNNNSYPYEDPSYHHSGPLSPTPTYTSGPAPTYHTTQPRPAMNTNTSYQSDRFAAPPQPQQQWSPMSSTRYEPTEYTAQGTSYHVPISPENQRPPSFQSFGAPPAGQARPPSFLQVGRKPVNGSLREL